ncbi:MAG: DivIVA domain-containing protein, partial [Mycobacteriales bacterium]
MTILLEILAVAAVVFGAAAFVVGRFEGMAEATPDSGDDNLPAGRIAAHMVDGARFGLAFRGYRMSEVDAVLDRLRDELADREAQLRTLGGDVAAGEPLGGHPAGEPSV